MNTARPQPGAAFRGETVILVNGLWMPTWALALLARRLRDCGYEVRSFTYRSVALSLRENADLLQQFVEARPAAVTHFVGYSLGGIVVHALFHYHPRQHPGRIVTLGSPHQGSAAAAGAARLALGRHLLGKSLPALLAGGVREWAWPPRSTGTIAGTLKLGIGCLLPGPAGPSDGTVRLAETWLPDAADQAAFPVSHFGLLTSRKVARAVCRFLDSGQFGP
ncbi:MAG: alpha/beta hydrolase [Gammaproteobacteria bacterium]|nr:alpha/beta hydrolase [Gammaproteobacteria bacterium]